MVNSLKNVSLSTVTPGTCAERVRERDRIGVVDAREPAQPGLAEQREMDA